MKQRTRNLKNSQTAVTVRGLYVIVPVIFEQSERSNWRTTRYEPADKCLARSNGGRNIRSNRKISVLNRNAENAAAVWDEFISVQTTSARSELSDWIHSKYELVDKISAQSNGEKSVGGGRKLLSETFSLFNLFSLFSLTVCICWRLSLGLKNPKR